MLDSSDYPKPGSGPAVLRSVGPGGQLPGGDVPGLREPVGPGLGGLASISAGELDLGQRPVRGGWDSGGATELPVEDGTGFGDTGTDSRVGPPEGRLGRRKRRLRDVAVLPGGVSNPGDALRGVAGGARVDQLRSTGDRVALPSPCWWSDSGAPWGSAVTHCRKMPGRNHGGPGKPGSPDLPVQRPTGAANQPAKAWRNPLGRLRPEP